MLNSQRPCRKHGSHPGGLTLEVFRPLRIVVDDQNAAAQWRHLCHVCGANLFLRQRAMAADWRCFNVKVEELIEGTRFVIAERLPVNEAVLAIEPERGLECRTGPGLQRQARVTSLPGHADDVFENRRGDSRAQVRIGRAHRLDFAGPWFELLEGTEAQEIFTL